MREKAFPVRFVFRLNQQKEMESVGKHKSYSDRIIRRTTNQSGSGNAKQQREVTSPTNYSSPGAVPFSQEKWV
jgi:hypothetical protein